jgi:hypothetical protein
MLFSRGNWLVIAVNAAGVLFIVLGLLALALPTPYEGPQLWELDAQHAISLMDAAGSFVLALGMLLTWLGSRIWHRSLRH